MSPPRFARAPRSSITFAPVSAIFATLLSTVATGCVPHPVAIDDHRVLHEVAANYRAFYPAAGDPDPARDAGVLRPRFGLPAIARTGDAIEIQLLQRGGTPSVRAVLLRPDVRDDEAWQCASAIEPLPTEGCFPLALSAPVAAPVSPGVELARFSARPTDVPPEGPYDLFVISNVDAPSRLPRAVWLRDLDPASLPSLRIAHLSDLHVGKSPAATLATHLREVIAEVNLRHPDVVVITGDITNRGDDPAQAPEALSMLLGLQSPVLLIVGNHDLGFGLEPIFGTSFVPGWSNFARSFHALLHYRLALGNVELIGFDTGASAFSARIQTRGVLPETVAMLRADLDDTRRAGRKAVVLFSHAPSRAGLVAEEGSTAPGHFGQMRYGNEAFEKLLLDEAANGPRVLHLAGHTHWSDVFESRLEGDRLVFARSSLSSLPRCPTPLSGRATLVTTQSADHSGIPFKEAARGWGFTLLDLAGDDARVTFHRYGIEPQPACP